MSFPTTFIVSLVSALASPQSNVVASPLTKEARESFIKSADEGCFAGQSSQAANRSRNPDELRRFCSCAAEKISYTMTMEGFLASAGKPYSSTPEEQKVMDAIFANCWHINVK
jgi:hypothetical protein